MEFSTNSVGNVEPKQESKPAGGLAVTLMTMRGRVSWSDPLIAGGQTMLIGIVMSVGASLGDILPEN